MNPKTILIIEWLNSPAGVRWSKRTHWNATVNEPGTFGSLVPVARDLSSYKSSINPEDVTHVLR